MLADLSYWIILESSRKSTLGTGVRFHARKARRATDAVGAPDCFQIASKTQTFGNSRIRFFRYLFDFLALPPEELSGPKLAPKNLARREQELKKYRAKLAALPANELQSLFKSEVAKAQAEKVAELQRWEDARFFHQPSAKADFEHWSKAAYWSIEEAVALAMGKAPELVSSKTIQRYRMVSPFVRRYSRLLDLANRATACQKLFDPVYPIIFVSWAKDNEIELPAGLAEMVIRRSGTLIDWKGEYEKLKDQHDRDIADWKGIVGERTELLERSIKITAFLKSDLAQCQAELAAKSESAASEKAQSPRERENMLKVIYAMAVGGYGFSPSKERSTLVPDIMKDLELAGLSLSDDTVRRYIKAACEHLPEWQHASR
jgi:hypothetical protein